MRQTIPLVVYRNGERVVIGEAILSDDGYLMAKIDNKQIIDIQKMSFGYCSFVLDVPNWFLRRWRNSSNGRHARKEGSR